MWLDRHRVARAIELSALERVAQGPERLLREEDVALLVKAAYDDATDGARAEFMARVEKMPASEWPWTAVRATAPRVGAGGAVGAGIGSVVATPKGPTVPAVLVLIRGQADAADLDPGDRLPARGSPEGLLWEPLHRALDSWDTATIVQWIGPQGWIAAGGATAGQAAKEAGNTRPAEDPTLPVPQPAGASIPWTHPAVLAAGAAVVVAAGVVVYTLGQERSRRRLEDALSAQERS